MLCMNTLPWSSEGRLIALPGAPNIESTPGPVKISPVS